MNDVLNATKSIIEFGRLTIIDTTYHDICQAIRTGEEGYEIWDAMVPSVDAVMLPLMAAIRVTGDRLLEDP